MDADLLNTFLVGGESKRDRQVQVGPSEIGGCRRRVWMRLNNAAGTNDTLKLAARMGTAIHKQIEREIKSVDPFGDRFMVEVEASALGLTGHVDLYDKLGREVVDWKTTTKKNLGKFPSEQQRTQVHVYGLLLSKQGYTVEFVTLVAICRDGNEMDVRQHTEPFDAEFAMRGVDWLREVQSLTEAPEPEMHYRFCRDYCQFFGDGCEGLR